MSDSQQADSVLAETATDSAGSSSPIQGSELLNPARMADVEAKHKLVAEFLAREGFDSLLLQTPQNFSWFTCGATPVAGSASIFITPESRVLLCRNSDSPQFFDRELPGLGFQLKERPWTEPHELLVADMCRGRKVAADSGFAETTDAADSISRMRLPLSPLECEQLRDLGKRAAHAVEAAARQCWRGQTEAQIAGQVAHRLIKHRAHPVRIEVWADRAGERHRRWGYGEKKVDRVVRIGTIAERWGLCVGVSRTVSFGEIPSDFEAAYQKALMLQATGMFFSQAEWQVFDTWNRVARIFEKLDLVDEWRSAEQADVIGYRECELPIVPNSQYQLTPRTAVHWHPSVGPCSLSDTILVGTSEHELITPAEGWPKLKAEVKGVPLYRPAILKRPLDGEEDVDLMIGEGSDAMGDSILMKPADSGAPLDPSGSGSIFDGGEEATKDSIFD